MDGAELRIKLRFLGISEQEFANRLGVPLATVKAWQNNKEPLTKAAIDSIETSWWLNQEKIQDVIQYCEKMEADQDRPPETVNLTIFKSGESHYRADPDQTWAEHTAEVGSILSALCLEGFEATVSYAPEEDS